MMRVKGHYGIPEDSPFAKAEILLDRGDTFFHEVWKLKDFFVCISIVVEGLSFEINFVHI